MVHPSIKNLTLWALFALLSRPVLADFQSGLQAYDRGDYAAALREWQPLAEKGDANAQYNVGLLYAKGQGVAQDYKQAADWYRKAADQGVAAAQYNLGVMYANGEGLPQDPETARKWFLKAAEKGVNQAITGLGETFDNGPGSFRNAAEAEKWYRKAAEQGVASAQFTLGVMYDLGQGVPRNYEEAVKWYQKAAEQGYRSAMLNLGILYYNAQGVRRDLVAAYSWFARAQKSGDPRAAQFVHIAASKMKPDQVRDAQRLAESWQPKAPARAAQNAELFLKPPERDQPAKATSGPAAGAADREMITPRPAPPPKPATTGKPAAAIQDVWRDVDKVVAVGDVHGDFEQFVAVLRSAGLIDSQGNWTGGKTHLVQTGDVVDRGPNSREIMDLLIKLEQQATAVGGAVHSLIGNHEAMDIYGDLRDVSPGEYAALRQTATGEPARPGSTPGLAEHRAAFGPEGKYGKWIRGHNAVIQINDTLFVHAGIGPKYAGWGIDRMNQEVRNELEDFQQLHGGIVTDEEGPLWYRGLAQGDEQKLAPLVDSILENHGAHRIVVGHTYAEGAITPRFGGKVILIDIGLSRFYDNIGKLGCLVIENGQAYALHRGQGLALPKDEGLDLLRYLKQAAALDPKPSPLEPRIAELEARLASARAASASF